ncbi:MAG: Zn-finger nucleic acid-binding protein [Candidatus Krumholzibacteriia bacterium]|jgi:Zn-finger nucleic acid-binding protein
MRCPACENQMTELEVLNLHVDVCVGGCGGVWFDWYELKKIEKRHYGQGRELLLAKCSSAATSGSRACPRCQDTFLLPHFASHSHDLRVDECPNCVGFFLEQGELNAICEQIGSGPHCAEAITRLFADLAAEGLVALPNERDLSQSRIHGVARMLCLILPTSDYLPPQI